MKVARDLLEHPTSRLGEVARLLEVDVRTLWNWRQEASSGRAEKKIGRPVYTLTQHRQAIWSVGRELRRQGYPGWRAVSHALRGAVPDQLIQTYVRGFKKKREDRRKERRVRHRVKVEVTNRDVIWGQDGTHVGRQAESGVSIESQVLRDRGTLAIIGLETGACADHHEVITLFDSVAASRGGYPLVWSRDNGSMYAHEWVAAHMEVKQVIELRSLPRTPQHNGATKITMRELKGAADLGKGSRLVSAEKAHVQMQKAQLQINKNRVRRSKGFKTSNELDEKLPAIREINRGEFYQKCRTRMALAVDTGKSVRAGRLAEREAIFRTLEEYGLIKRTRGGKPYAPKPEIFL